MTTTTLPSSRDVREVIGQPKLIDVKTAVVILVMSAGFPIIGVLHHRGLLPWWATVLIGTWLMNLSFTAWHEPSHRNFSRIGWLNTFAGWIASFASIYPGYFARRREHLIHHRFEGQEGLDPVYPRIQTNFWLFPLEVLRSIVQPATSGVPDSFLPLTGKQRLSDAISNLLAFGLLAFAIWQGFWLSVLMAWFFPRAIVFVVHAYYICFFPHNDGGHGFVVLRNRQDHPLLRFLTMNQHLHGIHHRWPWVPWHQYRRVLAAFPDELSTLEAHQHTLDATPETAMASRSNAS